MSDNTKSPLQMLTDMWAEMTERAIKAEQERDEARKRQLDWYRNWEAKDKECKEAQRMLADEIRAHQKTTAELGEAYDTVKRLCESIDTASKPQNAPIKP